MFRQAQHERFKEFITMIFRARPELVEGYLRALEERVQENTLIKLE